MADVQLSNELAAWQALTAHYQQIKDVHLRRLFAEDPGRGERLTGGRRRTLSRLFKEPHHG